MPRRKVCVVTGSRADYGLLYWPMRLLREDPDFELQTVVTGMHLAPEFGSTWRQVADDGFSIAARVEMLLSGDTSVAVTKSLGLGVIGFADALSSLAPDLMLILGDRYEILAAAQAALIAGLPVAHLCGGDLTEGAFDDAIRHAITKMSHIHFVTNVEAERRLLQMGEAPARVYRVGSPGLDHIARSEWLTREAVFEALGLWPRKRNLVVTFHPATLDAKNALGQLDALLGALDDLGGDVGGGGAGGGDVGLILTGSNADTEGRALTRRLAEFARNRDDAVFSLSLGQNLYLNALKQADAVVGNSSSGLYEAPSFRIPTVNIGDRQGGRLKAGSVIDCQPERAEILAALRKAFELDCSKVENPYGDGKSAPRIVAALKAIDDPIALVRKGFHDQRTP